MTVLIIPRLFWVLFHMVSPRSAIHISQIFELFVSRFTLCSRSQSQSPLSRHLSLVPSQTIQFRTNGTGTPPSRCSALRFVSSKSTMERMMYCIANYLKCCYAKRGASGFIILSRQPTRVFQSVDPHVAIEKFSDYGQISCKCQVIAWDK